MTSIEPYLSIRRLLVFKDGSAVYDQPFHPGVNIIRGDNASGKTTVIQLLAHSLGYMINPRFFKKEALACDYTFCEIEVNGAPLTLRRDINEGQSFISLFWGDYEEASASAAEGWNRYSFRATESKESFDQTVFRALGMPEVKGDNSINITMHQLLRVIIKDQLTQVNRVFSFEQFDSSFHRETIGDMFLGSYDNATYELQLKKKEIAGQLSKVKADILAAERIFREAAQERRFTNITSEIQLLTEKRKELSDTADALKLVTDIKKLKSKQAHILKTKIAKHNKQKKLLTSMEERARTLELEYFDSEYFIEELENRLSCIDESHGARESFGELSLELCPYCLSILEQVDTDSTCHLCKQPLNDSKSWRMRQRNELILQLRESKRLQDTRYEDLASVKREIPGQVSTVDASKVDLMAARKDVGLNRVPALDDIYRDIGKIDATIEKLHEEARISALLSDWINKKAKMTAELSIIEDKIALYKSQSENKRAQSMDGISRALLQLLSKDIDRENDFQNITEVEIDFGNDRLLADGRENYAASSLAFISTAFHLAILQASCDVEHMNYPRLSIIDSIEDKGMDTDRKHNLQRLIVDTLAQSDISNQMIFTTADLDPELDLEHLTVGPKYTPDNRSLDL